LPAADGPHIALEGSGDEGGSEAWKWLLIMIVVGALSAVAAWYFLPAPR
jgi:hypothetical protein